MSNMSLKREIMQIIEETIKNDVTSEMLLMELYAVGIDSLKIIQIVVGIEEKYDIKLDKMFEDDTIFENLQVFIDKITHEVKLLGKKGVL